MNPLREELSMNARCDRSPDRAFPAIVEMVDESILPVSVICEVTRGSLTVYVAEKEHATLRFGAELDGETIEANDWKRITDRAGLS